MRQVILCLSFFIFWCATSVYASGALHTPNAPVGFEPSRIWIDTDPSIGQFLRDVDDGYALVQAFHSPEVSIAGVSVIFGNTRDISYEEFVARQIVENYGPRGLEVYRGAASAADLGVETPAVRALAQALSAERLRIMALGPLTTVATVILNHPELISKIDEVAVMAGRRLELPVPIGRFGWKMADSNVNHDKRAIGVLLKSPVPLTIIPTELAAQVMFDERSLRTLAEGGLAGRWLASKSWSWLRWWKKFFGTKGFIPFDTLVIEYAVAPQLIACEDFMPTEFKKLRDDTFLSAPGAKNYFLTVSRALPSKRTSRYCYGARTDLKSDILSRLSRGATY